MPKRLAVIVKGYPRLSETFIAQEILALERAGLDQVIVSLRAPGEAVRHGLHEAITAPVLYLPEYLHQAPERVARARDWARRQPGYGTAYARFRADFRRDRSRSRWRRFGQACVLAAELPTDIAWLHSHYLHTPASVTDYAAAILGLGWSFSAHAKDIWTTPDWDLSEKLTRCRWGVTCTEVNRRHLAGLAEAAGLAPGRVGLVYHGLDFSRFPDPAPRPPADGRGAPVTVLSVGRAVAKKGYDDLLAALARLPAGLAWRFRHVGAGDQLPGLRARAEALGLADRITWRGALAQADVIAEYQAADLFVLPSKIAADGDRDGLPNVLMEAQALGLACLSTAVSAIPELILDGETGVLVPPGDPDALAGALVALITEPARRARLADAGAARCRSRFAMAPGIRALADRFAPLLGLAPGTTRNGS